jgi:ribosomal protein L40E
MIKYISMCCGYDTIDEVCTKCHQATNTFKAVECRGRGCGSYSTIERHDYYGITTGHWCEDCYNDDNQYTYRKDRYPIIEHDGYGEQLDDDY